MDIIFLLHFYVWAIMKYFVAVLDRKTIGNQFGIDTMAPCCLRGVKLQRHFETPHVWRNRCVDNDFVLFWYEIISKMTLPPLHWPYTKVMPSQMKLEMPHQPKYSPTFHYFKGCLIQHGRVDSMWPDVETSIALVTLKSNRTSNRLFPDIWCCC